MTTDYTSGTINQNIKTAAAQNRTFQAANGQSETGAFDAVFENVSKSYADNSEIKNTKQNSKTKDYASATKDVNSAKKAAKTSSNTNTKAEAKSTTTTEKTVKKDSAFNEKTKNLQKQSVENKETTQNQIAQNQKVVKETNTQTTTFNEETVNNFAENKDLKTVNNTQDNFVQNDNPQVIETPVENQNREVISQDNTEIIAEDNQIAEKEEYTEVVETTPQIVNEQILANITYNAVAEVVETTTVFDETKPETTVNTDSVIETEAETPQPVETPKFVQGNILQNDAENAALEQFSKELAQNFADVLPKETNTLKADTQSLSDTVKQTELQTEEVVKPAENFVQGKIQSTIENSEDISVEVLNSRLQIPEETTQTETRVQKTAQQNLAADTSRLTINLEEQQQFEKDTVVLTPEQTLQEAETAEVPLVQVTDEVAQKVKNFTEKVQNIDFAGKVKDKITAKLGDLLGSSTVVTDFENAQSSIHPEMNSNSNGNTSLSQGNAAEQAIKMSIENVAEQDTSVDNFISQLEAKLNAGTKTANIKQATNLNLNKADILSQLNEKFGEMQQSGQNKVSIILRPENLGRVSVEIMNSKDGIIAKMLTDNQQVRDLLDKNIEALRANLSSQGVNVNNIKVECTNQSENNAMDFDRQAFEQNQQDFQGESRHNNHTNKSDTTFWDSLNNAENTEEAEETHLETEQTIHTNNTVKHNGKIDYKV